MSTASRKALYKGRNEPGLLFTRTQNSYIPAFWLISAKVRQYNNCVRQMARIICGQGVCGYTSNIRYNVWVGRVWVYLQYQAPCMGRACVGMVCVGIPAISGTMCKVSGTYAAYSHSSQIRDTFKVHSSHIRDTFKLYSRDIQKD